MDLSSTRTVCRHCGLPVAPGSGYRTESGEFCCLGCALAWRIVGDQERAGPLAGIVLRLGIAAALAMNVMMLSLLLYSDPLAKIGDQATQVFRWVLLGLSAPVLFILGGPYVHGAGRDIRRGLPSIDSLIALGALAGFGVSAAHVIRNQGYVYFDTVTMLLVLVTVGRLLEASARVEASRALQDLVQLKPANARVISDSGDLEVPVDEVQVGQKLRVRPGERVPVDGIIAAGRSSVQEAALTGEFRPRACGMGDQVFGSSVNGDGEIIVVASAVGTDTLLERVAALVRQAQAQRAPIERLADRAATVFVPFVVFVAAGAVAYWAMRGEAARGVMSGLAVLVVACPCALGLATPLAVCSAIARAAREGVLIRTGEALEKLARVRTVLFDKTATLTEGRPVVREARCCSDAGTDENGVLSRLASLESASEHALGRCIANEARARNTPTGTVSDFRAFPGEGAIGCVSLNGARSETSAGTDSFLSSRSIDMLPAVSLPPLECGDSVVFVAWDGQVRGRVALTDVPRGHASETVRLLQGAGFEVAMLSGDRRDAAEHIARLVGIDEVKAECSPVAKVAEVHARQQRGEVTAVVGDGINDAPALAAADVGIAMGCGTDLAREVGEVTLMRDELLLVPWLLGLSKRTGQAIRMNLTWAFGYNLIAIALAASGHLHPLIAALLMLGSSLFVIRNSLRLAHHAGVQTKAGLRERTV